MKNINTNSRKVLRDCRLVPSEKGKVIMEEKES
jgi:hypothetical protein